MKKRYKGGFLAVCFLLAGCTALEPTPYPRFSDDQNIQIQTVERGVEEIEADLTTFFKAYFALSEEDVLVLNQDPSRINTAYWETYKAYEHKLLNAVGGYLSPQAKEQIKKQYLSYDFHLPKKLLINEYVTLGPARVDGVKIVAKREMGENTIYQVAVTTYNLADPIYQANNKYKWDEDKNYYVQVLEGSLPQTLFSSDLSTVYALEDSYLYASKETEGGKDEVRLVQHYWVDLTMDPKLQIHSVKEAAPIQLDESIRQMATHTSHIERIAYFDEPSAKEQGAIKTVIYKLMIQPKGFYTYYEKALHTDYDHFKSLWVDQLKLEEDVEIHETLYKEAFGLSLNPYKDSVEKIEPDLGAMKILPSIYATRLQPRFIVHVPIKATLNNNEIVYYNDKYYVGMEQGKVEFIQFMSREELKEGT